MQRSALGFFVLGLLALLFGVTGAAGVSLETARSLLLLLLCLAGLSLLAGLADDRRLR